MRSCTDPRSIRGQALVEAAIVVPLGLLLLLAVGYLGRGLIERQRMLMVARVAARQAAMDATRGPVNKFTGAGVLQAATLASAYDPAAKAAAGSQVQVQVSAPGWGWVTRVPTQQLHPLPLGPYAMAFTARSSRLVDGRTAQFSLGFVLYGAKVSEKLSLLETTRKNLESASRTYGAPPSVLGAPLTVSGSAFMPGEAPAHLPGVGILETNSWIYDIVSGK